MQQNKLQLHTNTYQHSEVIRKKSITKNYIWGEVLAENNSSPKTFFKVYALIQDIMTAALPQFYFQGKH